MKIQILNLTFDVEEVECIEHGTNDVGRIDHINQKIYLNKKLCEERKKVVLLHEIIHSIFQQMGFVDEHDNEQLIDCLALALTRLSKDNPKLISFFQS